MVLTTVRRAVEGEEHPLVLAARDAWTLVDHPHPNPASDRPGPHRYGLARRIARRVLHHVDERPLELRRVAAQERQVPVHRQLEELAVSARQLNRLVEHLLDRAPPEMGLELPGLQQ